MLSDQSKRTLLLKAKEALEFSYSPYSGNKIGAAVLTSSGNIYVGANIGNSCSTLNCCAEQVAINTAVMNGEHRLTAIAVCQSTPEPCYPCGRCLQLLAEFADDMVVLTENNNEPIENSLSFLLPLPFLRSSNT